MCRQRTVHVYMLISSALIAAIFQNAQAQTIMKTIHLSEFTPQAILHIPSYQKVGGEETEYTCHFWLTFLDGIAPERWEHHSDFGISLGAMGLRLTGGDSVNISSWKPSQDDSSKHEIVDSKLWNKNVSSSVSPTVKLEYSGQGVNLCIKFMGSWKNSTADLLATLYYTSSTSDTSSCPKGMLQCDCSRSGGAVSDRCISKDLFCNGIINCPLDCTYDESERSPVSCRRTEKTYLKEPCVWTDFEYLLMMVMTGFLLILIPVVFLLTMMYHRRASAMNFRNGCDGNNNTERCREYPHVISTVPRYVVDEPPRYDDLPEELKVPSCHRQCHSQQSQVQRPTQPQQPE